MSEKVFDEFVGAQGHVILSEILQIQLSPAFAWPKKKTACVGDMRVSIVMGVP